MSIPCTFSFSVGYNHLCIYPIYFEIPIDQVKKSDLLTSKIKNNDEIYLKITDKNNKYISHIVEYLTNNKTVSFYDPTELEKKIVVNDDHQQYEYIGTTFSSQKNDDETSECYSENEDDNTYVFSNTKNHWLQNIYNTMNGETGEIKIKIREELFPYFNNLKTLDDLVKMYEPICKRVNKENLRLLKDLLKSDTVEHFGVRENYIIDVKKKYPFMCNSFDKILKNINQS
jgi:hypothetical protein